MKAVTATLVVTDHHSPGKDRLRALTEFSSEKLGERGQLCARPQCRQEGSQSCDDGAYFEEQHPVFVRNGKDLALIDGTDRFFTDE